MVRPSKDYSALIGKRFGDRTVLSIIKNKAVNHSLNTLFVNVNVVEFMKYRYIT